MTEFTSGVRKSQLASTTPGGEGASLPILAAFVIVHPVPVLLPLHRLLGGHIASRYLVLVSCEGGEDFFLLAPRHFDEVKGAPKLSRDLVEFI